MITQCNEIWFDSSYWSPPHALACNRVCLQTTTSNTEKEISWDHSHFLQPSNLDSPLCSLFKLISTWITKTKDAFTWSSPISLANLTFSSNFECFLNGNPDGSLRHTKVSQNINVRDRIIFNITITLH